MLTSSVLRHRREILDLVHAIHENPELSLREFETTALIRSTLESIGVEIYPTPSLETGVVGVIRGERPGRTIALRADIDALPVTEDPGHEIRSKNEGVMHACGHDVHTAALLGAAMALQENRAFLRGTVVLFFQPDEESSFGANLILKTGVFRELGIEAVFATHVVSHLPAGRVGVQRGPVMSAQECFSVTVRGAGGHGASPHLTRDPIMAGATMIQAFQTISSRRIDPAEPFAFSVCTFHGGERWNVIPDQIELSGTIRFLNEDLREKVRSAVRDIAEETAAVSDCTAEVRFFNRLLAVDNDEDLYEIAMKSAEAVCGKDTILHQKPWMASEDFGLYRDEAPIFMYHVGTGEPGCDAPHHSPAFRVRDEIVLLTARLMAQTALDAAAPADRDGI